MDWTLLLLSAAALVLAAGILFLVRALRCAPDGYEDRRGFHEVVPGAPPARFIVDHSAVVTAPRRCRGSRPVAPRETDMLPFDGADLRQFFAEPPGEPKKATGADASCKERTF